ncbi:IS66 family insertion sequence element accessory protein TnpA [Anaerotaenia torta]|uniref:IS66 family insertion sequence element accessory protein TnpA n=1 Tax=Anaerotaenia torta TaxID=433293 RepID=UPI003D1E55E4
MVQKEQRQPRRTDREEWLDLIQDCRTSGMSDKDWCDLHQIGRSSFYYHIRRFRNSACPISEASHSGYLPDGSICQCSLSFLWA